jgi:hypothetical protein
VRRRRLGESPETIAGDLGRTSRWVRKWVARHEEASHEESWATSRSRAPHTSPTRTPDELRQLILDARARLVANPRAQYGALAIAWELRHMGVEPIPERWTIEREIARAGLARPRRRQPGLRAQRRALPSIPWPLKKGWPQAFVAQVDLAELAAIECSPELLPADGLLSFFYDAEAFPWGYSPADRGGWAVVHTPSAMPLARRSFPEHLHAFNCFEAVPLRPTLELTT